jgi:hypothetical protein
MASARRCGVICGRGAGAPPHRPSRRSFGRGDGAEQARSPHVSRPWSDRSGGSWVDPPGRVRVTPLGQPLARSAGPAYAG